MTLCGVCNGTGQVTCPGCGGKRYDYRWSSRGDMDINACAICGGKGKTTCSYCAGRGTIGPTQTPVQLLPTRKRDPNADPLVGRWQETNGGWYEFQKMTNGYRVIVGSAIGATGQGTATLSGKRVTLDVLLPLIGRLRQGLELRDDGLVGYVLLFGVRVPMVLRPV